MGGSRSGNGASSWRSPPRSSTGRTELAPGQVAPFRSCTVASHEWTPAASRPLGSARHEACAADPLMETLLGDLRLALRMLVKAPLFALLSIGALALGIGANAVMFGVIETVLLEPLVYRDSRCRTRYGRSIRSISRRRCCSRR